MIKKFEIWNSEINMDEWKDFLEEDKNLNPGLYQTNEDDFLQVYKLNQEYLDDERANLDKTLPNPILVIANLGLWNGRTTAYKIIQSGNLKDILTPQVDGISGQHWYCDGYNICCDETHHDGTNHYLYREIKNSENIENFLNMIYRKDNWEEKLNYYTKSIASDIGRIYGLCN